MQRLIAYYRVSTAKQRASGLGLAAQQTAVADYARSTDAAILRAYVETESGRHSNREQLAVALAHARRSNAVLCIAKLDRLARNVAFTAALMEAKTPFVCVDNPHATPLTIHILAAIAEDEAKRIAQRTREALAAYKAAGGKLGSHRPECRNNLTHAARRKGAAAAGKAAAQAAAIGYADLVPQMVAWRRDGLSQQAIADKLNNAGQHMRGGRPWHQVQVARVLSRQN